MATSKKVVKPVDDKPVKKEETAHKKRKDPFFKSPWALAFLAMLGMYLLTFIWPQPFEELIHAPQKVEKMISDNTPLSPPFVQDIQPEASLPASEQPVQDTESQVSEPAVWATEEELKALQDKIDTLIKVTQEQEDQLDTLQAEVDAYQMELQAYKAPETLVEELSQHEEFSTAPLHLLTESHTFHIPLSQLFAAAYAGPLSREERAKAPSENLLEGADSSWKKALSQWVTVKKKTVEDYAMSYDEQWQAHAEKLKNLLASGDYAQSIAWVQESPILVSDVRFTEPAQRLSLYLSQQNLIERVRAFYAR